MNPEMQTIPQLEKEIQRRKIAVEELSVLNELAIAASSSLRLLKFDILVENCYGRLAFPLP
ncbi:MAG: hypothetical protein ONB32_16665 [candidate division KSB1 bacterium]|nr:hypothetical protein [candidate division KSB1 bacterium]